MKINKKTLSLFIFILILIIIYFIPASKTDFFETYKSDDSVSKSLKNLYKQPLQVIKINNINWKYYTNNSDKETILFIHGMGGAYDLWWQQIEALNNDYNIISFTLPDEINTLNDAANGIKSILEKENVSSFNVVGTSMGGYITQYLIKIMPERINKAVLGNTFPPNDIIVKENKLKSTVTKLLPEIAIDVFRKKSLKEKLLPTGENDKILKSFLPSLPFSKKGFIGRYEVVTDFFTINPCLYKYKRIPKLIIESDNDPLIPPILRTEIKELYQDAKVFTFHNKGHFPYINEAKKYNEILINFFTQPNEITAIEKTIQNYFTGRKNSDIGLLKTAFNDNATLQGIINDSIIFVNLNQYLNKVKTDGKQKIETSILDIKVSKNMAFAETEFKYKDKTFKDYLTLLKDNNWNITSKTFEKTN
jgi:pimeloyl-ACP methyl ester carboxylesterase